MGKTIGVIGGMGPEASLLFYNMVIGRTAALRDQDHLDMVILNHASMPDRTAMLLGGRGTELLTELLCDVEKLEKCGADAFVITCNTSHALASELAGRTKIPLINMVEEAAGEAALRFAGEEIAAATTGGSVAVLATDGTVRSEIYHRALENAGMKAWTPSAENQRRVMSIIYDGIKGGGHIDPAGFKAIEGEIRSAGCVGAILGCTELSVYRERVGLPEDFYLDAMLVLAEKAITFAGKELKRK